jgi:ABC-type nitrate/sulfonate/bicarbonate transport system substrate-binding protein
MKGTMKKSFLFLIIIVFLGAIAFLNKTSPSKEPDLEPFLVALDWTPNTNHTGLYVALKKGWYKEEGIDLKILPYSQVSADTLVYEEKADAGISSTENIVALSAVKSPVISIAAIVGHNSSGLIVLEESGIKSPKDLDGKIYGGFGMPYEEAVIKKVIIGDGGTGKFKNITLETGAMQALESKKVDFVWVFEGWDALIAEKNGLKTRFFPITDYGIPDYYTPNIITGKKQIESKNDLLRKFMKATAHGYEFARINPEEAAKILTEAVQPGTFPDIESVYESQKFMSNIYAEEGRAWGIQSREKWQGYPQFMVKNRAVPDDKGKPVESLNFDSLYTNEFLPK